MQDYPIKPDDIKTSNSFWNAFGNTETEISARFLVKMAQKNGGWRDFTKNEIDTFSGQDFWFNRLIDDGTNKPPIRVNGDGSFSFTHKFIAKCFLSSPATTIV